METSNINAAKLSVLQSQVLLFTIKTSSQECAEHNSQSRRFPNYLQFICHPCSVLKKALCVLSRNHPQSNIFCFFFIEI